MIIKYLLRKEFTQIRRDSFLPRLIFFYPIMLMCVMPWIMNMEVKNIVVDVVDNDRSTQSQQLVHEIEASKYFIFHGQQPTYSKTLDNIERSKADIAIVIPQHYSRDLTQGKMPQVLIAANAINGTKGAMGAGYLSQIVSANAIPTASAIQSKISTLYLYNKHLNFKLFMIPALFAMLIMMVTGFLPTLNIVSEKEKGTIEQINVTPVGKGTFILSKLIPYWIIAFFIITVCLALAWGVYGITPVGNVACNAACAVLFVVRTHHFELLRQHATSHICDVVLRCYIAFAIWLVHSHTFYAFACLSHYLHKSRELLYRSHAYGIYSRRKFQ